MATILILYSTTDGHTRHICQHIQQRLEAAGHRVTLVSIINEVPDKLDAFDKIVIGARIRYGLHQRQVFDFVREHQALLDSRPNAFFSVNIVARKPEKNRPETNPYLRKFLQRTLWKPKRLAVFAGRLDYPACRFYDRWAIQFIMWMTKGPTDPSTVVEFTDWQAVDRFAQEISVM